MNFRIRPAAPEDYEAVVGIANEAFYDMVEELPHLFRRVPHSIPRREYDGKLADPNVFMLLAETQPEERVAGFLVAEMRQAPVFDACAPRRYGYVSYFGVKEGYQKQGIGSSLFKRCIEEVSGRGGTFMELKVWEFNDRAIRFYEKFGMRTLNRTMELSLRHESTAVGADRESCRL